MKIAVVGAGVLGLTLGYRLAALGHRVDLYEDNPEVGGLCASQSYGEFTWDRFYHCILPTDARLLALLGELGLGDDIRWARTGTGYYASGRFHDMSSNRDFLRFPLLSLAQKARLGGAMLYATRLANPDRLHRFTARDWLIRLSGRRTYEVFWQPLLKAKFGDLHDKVAAEFIYATLKRLAGARSAATNREKLGYVRGGYATILTHLVERLRTRGVSIHVNSPVEVVRPSPGGTDVGPRCDVFFSGGDGHGQTSTFDQVFFTSATPRARRIASPELLPHVEKMERDYPSSGAYLGIVCNVLVLRRPLTPYYVLNIADPEIELTGLIEMTNLVDRDAETAGRSLVYLPRYLDSLDPRMDATDGELSGLFLDRGLKRLFPGLRTEDLLHHSIHRARFVQPLPLARDTAPPREDAVPKMERPFQILNTSMLRCATLNNEETVGLTERFLEKNRQRLTPS